ncbi:MAG: class I SAM-dependent methyltransferase [Planctomycetaceae bacterium]
MTGSPETMERVEPRETALDDNAFYLQLISRIINQDPAQVRQRFVDEHRCLGTNVQQAMLERQLPFHEWSDRLVAFYEQTDAFLFESLAWNRTAAKQDMRRWTTDFLTKRTTDPQRVLTYGDGLGFDSLACAQAGHRVTYFEVSQRCRQFAQAVFQRADVSVNMIDDPQNIPHEGFDAVVCLDVLEHVPDPPQLVQQLSRAIRVGGTLISHAPFYLIHPSLGTHLRSNTQYSGDCDRLYRPFDLHPIAGNFFWNPIVLEKSPSGQRPAGAGLPFAARAGGCLLAAARRWHVPHVRLARLLARADQRKLAELVRNLAVLCATPLFT